MKAFGSPSSDAISCSMLTRPPDGRDIMIGPSPDSVAMLLQIVTFPFADASLTGQRRPRHGRSSCGRISN